MKRLLTAAALAALLAAPAFAAEPGQLRDGAVLRRRLDRHHRDDGGGERRSCARSATRPKVDILSVPVTYAGLVEGRHRRLPRQLDADDGGLHRALPRGDGTVEVVRANLEGAKYTLAVSKSLADAGLKDFADIAKFGDQLDDTIYGIEPGNDGNKLILDMIAKDAFGLGKFELKESSEQGMLAQAKRAEKSGKGIVFLGWEPHPMNKNLKMVYLTGGDECLRAELRRRHGLHQRAQGATSTDCPNLGKFLAEPGVHA